MTDQSAPIDTVSPSAGVPIWVGPAARREPRPPAELVWPVLRSGIDLVSVITSLAIAGALVPVDLTTFWTSLTAMATIVAFGMANLYAPRSQLAVGEEIRRAVTVLAFVTLAVGALGILVTDRPRIGDVSVIHWLTASVLVASGRLALYGAQRATTSRAGGSRTLIIGAGEVGRRIAQRLDEDWALGLSPIGFLDKEPLDSQHGDVPLPVLGASWDLEQIVAEQNVETVVVAFSTAPSSVMVELVRRCWKLGVDVYVVPRLFEVEGRRTRTEHLGAMPLVGLQVSDHEGWQFELKYALDRAFAACAVLLLAPLLGLIALLVKVTMGGPVLFRQLRVGRDGRHFDMLKFRTMRGAPERDGEANGDWARVVLMGTGIDAEDVLRPSADRRTPLGRVLRALSLDELPQLWNVLRGDMSLVGPRPEMPHYVERFESAIYRYPERHRVKSGLTGWAQIHGLRGDTSLADRIEWDNFYIENWTPWLDLKILFLTLPAVLRRKGAS
jgi:exopolysaccharide biosynthesis polyprenyl glycosylphosphotransferase